VRGAFVAVGRVVAGADDVPPVPAALEVDDDGADGALDGESTDFFAAHPVRQAAAASATAMPDDNR
jgi:hypothetical protein